MPSEEPTQPARDQGVARAAASQALVLLTLINGLNYVDRFLITALLPAIQQDLHLNDAQGGLLGTSFILVYFLTSPLFGWLGDRGVRKTWLALGIGLWSAATGLAGLARGYGSLLLTRAAVGVGEAAYGTISPSLLADYFPRGQRGRVLAIFYLAIPIGSALGYLLGGVVGQELGWRAACGLVGFPGLLLALAVLWLREPVRGTFDAADTAVPSLRAAYGELWSNRRYVWTVLGYSAYTFALGGLAFWAPSYLIRSRGLAAANGMLVFGGVTVVSGVVGTLGGGWLGDRLLRRTPRAYELLNSLSMLLAALLTTAALLVPGTVAFLVLLLLAEICLFASTGPVNALIVNSVRPAIRATAVAVSIFTIHLLGDALSPTLIGNISDRTNLATAMLVIPVVFLLAGVLWAVPLRSGNVA